MTRIFFRRRTPLLFVLTLLLVSFACNFFTGGPEADVPAAGVPTPEASITVEDLVFGPGEFILPDTKAGLADLTSYTATLMLSFDGTRAGKTEQWSKTYVMLTSKEPVERQLTIEKTGDLSDLAAVFMAALVGADYERSWRVIDKQGMSGKKVEYHSILYKSISHFSVETGGTLDLDAELKLYISGNAMPIKQEFKKGTDIVGVQEMLAQFVLK